MFLWVDHQNQLWRHVHKAKFEQQVKPNNVIAVSNHNDHQLILTSDGECWGVGSNYFSQLSGGTFIFAPKPVRIYGMNKVVQISAGKSNSAFLDSNGIVWGCGKNTHGQIANRNIAKISTPEAISNLPPATAICVGENCIVALDTDGVVWLNGYSESINPAHFNLNHYGQMDAAYRLKFKMKIVQMSADQNFLFAGEDKKTLWRCATVKNIPKTKRFNFPNGIMQICEAYQSVVLDDAGTLYYTNCDRFVEFPKSIKGEEIFITHFYRSCAQEFFFSTADDKYYVVPLSKKNPEARTKRIKLPFTPIPYQNDWVRLQVKSARTL